MRAVSVAVTVVLAGCFLQKREDTTTSDSTASAAAGTLSCREIVETCDSACQLPDCLHACTARGTAEAQQQHAGLVDCAQRNACMDEDCVRGNCPAESAACEASGPGTQEAQMPPPNESATVP